MIALRRNPTRALSINQKNQCCCNILSFSIRLIWMSIIVSLFVTNNSHIHSFTTKSTTNSRRVVVPSSVFVTSKVSSTVTFFSQSSTTSELFETSTTSKTSCSSKTSQKNPLAHHRLLLPFCHRRRRRIMYRVLDFFAISVGVRQRGRHALCFSDVIYIVDHVG